MPKLGQQHPIDKTRELQRRLYLAAKRSKGRRFHALYDRIYRLDVIKRAWMEVKTNGGSAGVDGKTIGEIEREGVEPFLEAIIMLLWLPGREEAPNKRLLMSKQP